MSSPISREDKSIAAGLVALAMALGDDSIVDRLDVTCDRLYGVLNESGSSGGGYTGVLIAMGQVVRVVQAASNERRMP